jgi:dTDP-L-rhamnose 4-epimerase
MRHVPCFTLRSGASLCFQNIIEQFIDGPPAGVFMKKRILITGGAGFIGSHLADQLLARGYFVGDVRDPESVGSALDGIDVVYHLAAAVGVGQSMYEIISYTDVNNIGTAVLLKALIERPVERLIVASSMSLYGEGLYRGPDGNRVAGEERALARLQAGVWDLEDESGAALEPVPTPETKVPSLSSIYALSKYDQERMCLMIGRAYGIPAVALRFFNVFGTRQALSNPYTGVLAIFAARLLNDRPPMIYEDGLQRRDFVSVHDVARALRLALETPEASGEALNIGSGESHSVLDVAQKMAAALGREKILPEITGKHRAGDIRHCFADISRARKILGYEPRVSLKEGLIELAPWLNNQIAIDRVAAASAELSARGLTR